MPNPDSVKERASRFHGLILAAIASDVPIMSLIEEALHDQIRADAELATTVGVADELQANLMRQVKIRILSQLPTPEPSGAEKASE